ncbi:mannosyl-glycoendo-beta-N-acetylglucosaminidase [Brevibacillus sp. SKDU10]|uniref:glycoside hydrolase family 73 protein n=1 Tax=Brevibacillus sp. SKDU10 TaxID=1247872 RepID=UPI0007C92FBE|nr:glucosaminidase domain-containing protein [Brevibacillus sp. SKDU10]OAJ73526.1 mannosyl-glycoendo-beta-N-acetylglucosaminidase [Brevibacillus sp. SKDU10]
MTKQERLISLIAPHVVGRYPCPSGVIAQLILEVGWDLRTPRDMVTGHESYNLGNIKGTGPAGSVTILTTEYYSAADVAKARASGDLVKILGTSGAKTKVQVKARFRAYNNYGEAIDDHFALLKKPRYVNAGVWKAKTPREFAEAVKRGGYATDPNYVTLIMSIVNGNKLARFDKPGVPVPIMKIEEAVSLALKEWQFELADKSIDNLAAQELLSDAAEWKERLRKEPQKVIEDMPWLVFVLADRVWRKVGA